MCRVVHGRPADRQRSATVAAPTPRTFRECREMRGAGGGATHNDQGGRVSSPGTMSGLRSSIWTSGSLKGHELFFFT